MDIPGKMKRMRHLQENGGWTGMACRKPGQIPEDAWKGRIRSFTGQMTLMAAAGTKEGYHRKKELRCRRLLLLLKGIWREHPTADLWTWRETFQGHPMMRPGPEGII